MAEAGKGAFSANIAVFGSIYKYFLCVDLINIDEAILNQIEGIQKEVNQSPTRSEVLFSVELFYARFLGCRNKRADW